METTTIKPDNGKTSGDSKLAALVNEAIETSKLAAIIREAIRTFDGDPRDTQNFADFIADHVNSRRKLKPKA